MKAGIGCLAAGVIGLIVIALIAGGMYVSAKNQMVTLNEQVKSNWSQVDVTLQRRADLIPNLVATVKGYAQHEEKVFDDVRKLPRIRSPRTANFLALSDACSRSAKIIRSSRPTKAS
jgi:hypothetical protein